MTLPSTTHDAHLEEALALHRRMPVAASYFEFYGYDSLFKPDGGQFADLAKLDRAHLRTFGCAVANGSAGYFQVGPDDYEVAGDQDWALHRLLRLYDAAMAQVQRCPRVRLVKTAADLRRRDDPQALAVVPLVTGHAWMKDLSAIDTMFRRGLRISHVGSVSCIHWCRPCPAVRVAGRVGPVLSEFGRQAVARMNELGILLDMAHVSDESTAAIVGASARPVIDSHTGSRTAVPDSRGHDDRTLRLIADRGGVAGIHFADHLWTTRVWGSKNRPQAERRPSPMWEYHRHVLDHHPDPDQRMAARKDRAAIDAFLTARGVPPLPPPPAARIGTVADMAGHVEHMVDVMGIDHVGLGGDVNGIADHQWPLGMDDVGQLPQLTAELIRRGWRETRIEKFLWRNWDRVLAEVLPQ